MADRLHDAQLDDRARQQPQRPVGVPGRRLAQTRGDHLGLLLAVEQLRRGRRLPLDAVERRLEAVFDQTSADVLDRLPAAAERIGDPLVGPAGPVGVGLQQDLGAADPLAGALELPDNLRELLAFLGRQANDMYLAHQSLLAQRPAKSRRAGGSDYPKTQT